MAPSAAVMVMMSETTPPTLTYCPARNSVGSLTDTVLLPDVAEHTTPEISADDRVPDPVTSHSTGDSTTHGDCRILSPEI